MNNERPPPSPRPPRKYPDLHDRMEELAILAKIRLERIEKQQAEIERLRGLLNEISNHHRKFTALLRGAQVPIGTNEAMDAIERCIREALEA